MVCVEENALRHVGYDSAALVIVIVKCCCCYCAVVAPKCPPPPPYMFMFRSRRATLTKRLTKAARKRRPPGGGVDDCAASAPNLETLLRQLQENQLEMLLRAVERGGGDCVLVRKEKTLPPPSQPHLLCCQTWRWPEVKQASELRRLPSCRSASDPVYVCCNPYHWSRLCLPGMCKECMFGCVDRLLYEVVSLECWFGNGKRFPVIHVDLKVTCERGMLFSEPACTEMYSGWANGLKYCKNAFKM